MTSYPQEPGFKTLAPETSRVAAESVKGRASTLREQCLTLLKYGESTADELAKSLGETILTIRPRVSELVKMGRIIDSGTRRRNASGKTAAVWKVAPPATWKEQNLFS